MSTSSAELESLATALEELLRRVTAMAEAASRSAADETAQELFAVERAMAGAYRKLARLAANL